MKLFQAIIRLPNEPLEHVYAMGYTTEDAYAELTRRFPTARILECWARDY